jgi:hypothetical protein
MWLLDGKLLRMLMIDHRSRDHELRRGALTVMTDIWIHGGRRWRVRRRQGRTSSADEAIRIRFWLDISEIYAIAVPRWADRSINVFVKDVIPTGSFFPVEWLVISRAPM